MKEQKAQTRLPKLLNADVAEFSSALKTVSRLGRVDCIAESYPLKQWLTDAEAAAIIRSSRNYRELVEKVAAAYDYDADHARAIVRLTKRYTRPEDLPDVPLGEAVTSLQAILRAFSPLSPVAPGHRGRNPLLLALANSMNDDQLSAMKEGLPISSLPPHQKNTVRSIAYFISYQTPLLIVANQLNRPKTLKNQDTKFLLGEDGKIESLRYIFEYRMNGKPMQMQVPLQHVDGSPMEIINGKEAFPLKVSEVDANSKQEQPGYAVSLQNVVQAEDNAFRQGASRGVDANGKAAGLSVESSISSKLVTVVDGNFASPVKMLQSLAFVYGLDAVKTGESSYTLARKRVRMAKGPEDAAEALKQNLPAPLLRALLSAGQRVQTEREKQAASQNKTLDPDERIFDKTQKGMLALRNQALQELARSLFPRIKGSEEGYIRYSKLTRQEHDRIGLTWLLYAAPGLVDKFILRPVPEYIAHLENMVLTGGLRENPDGSQGFTAVIAKREPNGRLGTQASIGPTPYQR